MANEPYVEALLDAFVAIDTMLDRFEREYLDMPIEVLDRTYHTLSNAEGCLSDLREQVGRLRAGRHLRAIRERSRA